MVEQKLREWAAAKGYRVAAGPAAILAEVEAELRARHEKGDLDRQFVGAWMGWIGQSRDEPRAAARAEATPSAAPQSVIGVVVPCPASRVVFTLPDRELAAVVPPTYCQDTRLGEQVRGDILSLLPELGGNLVPVFHGRKAIAARLGLTAYGVNNITYSPGIGSFLWIGAFSTTARVTSSGRQLMSTESMLPDCEACGRCRDACPMGAILEQRFLIRAERCLTHFNERPDPIPAWVPARAHNALVGCMICQDICPQNEGLLTVQDTGVVFSREETAALLGGNGTPLGAALLDKLAGLGLDGYRAVIGRNLALLAGASG